MRTVEEIKSDIKGKGFTVDDPKFIKLSKELMIAVGHRANGYEPVREKPATKKKTKKEDK